MTEAAPRSQVLTARVAIVAVAILLALALLIYGFSAEVHRRLWHDIVERPGGPMSFRFVLQPVMAAIAAFHDGVKDASQGRAPYLKRLLSGSGDRSDLLNEAVLSTGRIILLGLAMDGIYQYTVLKTFYPGEMVVITLALAFVPYLLLRGPFSRLASWWRGRKEHG
ncbi:hypothetical protein [Mesorhizobium sp. ZC-5]|uniref:hypothetical protein n=1 Tax=Mesorhizobium sp. ZC-5 TaxID=2986066 RepID=UPI0021E9AAD1|nr:hypothetical protein [Mesorhizobium sp. ZC-5]MCV3243721.1 hypothetical protein [Mesorhizobium sp. ZC-5]